ncbi:MAG: hypothetical protein ACE5JX_15445 [Acidobacteriota bacterium]
MRSIDLTDEEARTLLEVLEFTCSELRMEIAGTDRKDFREGLKKKKVFLRDLCRRLEKGLPGS